MEVAEKLQEIFRNVFDDQSIILRRDMTTSDVEGWDSLMHINLVVACENAFNVKFTMTDISRLKNVGEMMDLLQEKTE